MFRVDDIGALKLECPTCRGVMRIPMDTHQRMPKECGFCGQEWPEEGNAAREAYAALRRIARQDCPPMLIMKIDMT